MLIGVVRREEQPRKYTIRPPERSRSLFAGVLIVNIVLSSFLLRPSGAILLSARGSNRILTSRAPLRTSAMSCSASASASSDLTVVQLPCLSDNYGYIVHDGRTGDTAVVDTPDAETYQRELDRRGWKLSHVFNTHHHWDHTGGNLDLKRANGDVRIIGPVTERDSIPGIDVAVGGGDSFSFGSTTVSVLDVGGHTKGHVAFHFSDDDKIFVGDALFALGCGRMFEGTPAQFWNSLTTLRDLRDETVVYCAHEYTTSNAKFALSVEPDNADLVARAKEIYALRKRNEPTVPSLLGVEKRTNPFLRVDVSDEIRRNVGVTETDTGAEAFAKVRAAKDNFRG